jgi:hypothetical protein
MTARIKAARPPPLVDVVGDTGANSDPADTDVAVIDVPALFRRFEIAAAGEGGHAQDKSAVRPAGQSPKMLGWVVEERGVNFEWIVEGRGRIFKRDPVTLGPSSTGEEFAAVVSTLSMADQQAITTMVREILEERGA